MIMLGYTLGIVGTLTLSALVAHFAAARLVREAAGHDRPTIDPEDEDAVSCAIEGNLRMVLPHYVHVELNRPYHRVGTEASQ